MTVYRSNTCEYKIKKVTLNSSEVYYELFKRTPEAKTSSYREFRSMLDMLGVEKYSTQEEAVAKVKECIVVDNLAWSMKTAKEEWL